jgi:RHS repeat-associated protein
MGAHKLHTLEASKHASTERSNHLGNVLTLFTDKKIPVGTGNTVSYYKADLVSSMDYSPFGAPLKGRTFNGNGSRYGFNGKEKDNEIEGSGNTYDFGARIYSPRLGKFLSIDPLSNKLPNLSTYSYADNNPVYFVDQNGKNPVVALLAMFLGLKIWATVTQKTVFENIGVSVKGGMIQAGAAGKIGATIAASPNGNYALGVTMGGFLDLFSALGGGDVNGGLTKGNFYMGASASLSIGVGVMKSKTIKDLSGLFMEADVDAPIGGSLLYGMDEKMQGISGVGASASAGVGLGLITTNTKLFVFNNSDITKMAEESVALTSDYSKFKSSDKYENVTIKNNSHVNGKEAVIAFSIIAKNKQTGKIETLSSHTFMKLDKSADGNTFSSKSADDAEKKK